MAGALDCGGRYVALPARAFRSPQVLSVKNLVQLVDAVVVRPTPEQWNPLNLDHPRHPVQPSS